MLSLTARKEIPNSVAFVVLANDLICVTVQNFCNAVDWITGRLDDILSSHLRYLFLTSPSKLFMNLRVTVFCCDFVEYVKLWDLNSSVNPSDFDL